MCVFEVPYLTRATLASQGVSFLMRDVKTENIRSTAIRKGHGFNSLLKNRHVGVPPFPAGEGGINPIAPTL